MSCGTFVSNKLIVTDADGSVHIKKWCDAAGAWVDDPDEDDDSDDDEADTPIIIHT